MYFVIDAAQNVRAFKKNGQAFWWIANTIGISIHDAQDIVGYVKERMPDGWRVLNLSAAFSACYKNDGLALNMSSAIYEYYKRIND